MFRFNDQTPIVFSDDLPESVDVAIIGAGIIGISTAWYLQRRGLSVLICDKGRVAGEQSSRNWGWVRVTGRDPDEVPVAIDSAQCWEEIARQLDEDVGYTRQGLLALAESDEEMAEFEAWTAIAREHDFESRLLSKKDLADLVSVDPDKWTGGIISPQDGRAEPFLAVPAIARALHAKGVLIRENCAVRTLDIQGGRVTGVVTEAGIVKAASVVCATGLWSSLFLSNIGISLPQLAVRGTVARTVEAPEVFSGTLGLKDIFMRRRQDGGYTVATGFTEHTIGANSFRFLTKFIPSLGSASDIMVRIGHDPTQQSFPLKRWNADDASPFERNRVLNPAVSARGLKKIRRHLAKRIPALSEIELVESWAGMIDATPDVVPVMDEVNSCPGLFIATGFSGHGFGIGPGAGKVMADMVTGESPRFDLTRFRFLRFSDGSKMRPGPAI